MKNSLPRLNPNRSEMIVLNKCSSNFPEIMFYEWRTRGGLCTCHRFAPGVDPRRQLGEYVGEYSGIDWILCPWGGENSRHCFKFEGKRVGELPIL